MIFNRYTSPRGSKITKRIMINPKSIFIEAKTTCSPILDTRLISTKSGPKEVISSWSNRIKTVPRIAPRMDALPPTINIPNYQIESQIVNWSAWT